MRTLASFSRVRFRDEAAGIRAENRYFRGGEGPCDTALKSEIGALNRALLLGRPRDLVCPAYNRQQRLEPRTRRRLPRPLASHDPDLALRRGLAHRHLGHEAGLLHRNSGANSIQLQRSAPRPAVLRGTCRSWLERRLTLAVIKLIGALRDEGPAIHHAGYYYKPDGSLPPDPSFRRAP